MSSNGVGNRRAGLIKSVHITNFYHKDSGGISTSYNNLLAAATRRGRQVSLIVPGERESVEVLSEFTKIYYIPARKSPVFDRRYRLIMPWQYMLKGSAIRNILLEEKPDMIEVTDKYTLSMIGAMIRTNNFRRLGRPMLVHFSCERMDDNMSIFLPIGRLGKWVSGQLMRNYHIPSFDFHLANSEYTAAEFFECANGTRNAVSKWFCEKCWDFFQAPELSIEERVHVCLRGVNLSDFKNNRRSDDGRRKLCERAGVPEGAVLLFYAGRLSPEKNIGLLLDLMKQLSADQEHDYRLLIAGDGPKAKWMTGKAEKIVPEKIIQFGHVGTEELAELYANTDIFVHPNPREPFGIAPLEAMASGLPLVAPNSGGVLSYANEKNSWLVEPTPEAFAAAIRSIVKNERELMEKIRNAAFTVREYTSERSADRLLDTYDRLYEVFLAKRPMFTHASGDVSKPATSAAAYIN
jgi:phosphatidylinositol alpha 1,6-mannosyltransferase